MHCGGSHRTGQTEFLLFFSRNEIRNRRKEAGPVMVFSVDHSGLASVLPSALFPPLSSVCPFAAHSNYAFSDAPRVASHRPFWVLFAGRNGGARG